MFLLIGVPFTSISVLVYRSSPWKNPIYKNKILITMLAIDLIIMLIFYAGNHMMAGIFETVKLPMISCLILFLISLSSQAAAFVYTYLVHKLMHPEYGA